MICPHCEHDNDSSAVNCAGCGAELAKRVPDKDGVFYCYRHRTVETRLRCGRCGRPICTRCAMLGHAGPRCPECGKANIPIRTRAIGFEVGRTFKNIYRGPRSMFAWIITAVLVFTVFRACSAVRRNQQRPPIEPEHRQDAFGEPDGTN